MTSAIQYDKDLPQLNVEYARQATEPTAMTEAAVRGMLLDPIRAVISHAAIVDPVMERTGPSWAAIPQASNWWPQRWLTTASF